MLVLATVTVKPAGTVAAMDIVDRAEESPKEPVPPEELQKVKNNFAAAEYRRLSSNTPILMHLIRNDGEGDWREINEAAAKYQAVTAADVQRVTEAAVRFMGGIDTIVVSTQHDENVGQEQIARDITAARTWF